MNATGEITLRDVSERYRYDQAGRIFEVERNLVPFARLRQVGEDQWAGFWLIDCKERKAMASIDVAVVYPSLAECCRAFGVPPVVAATLRLAPQASGKFIKPDHKTQ